MIAVIALLALAYGTPHMSFPWWVWGLAILFGGGKDVIEVRLKK